MVTGQAFLRNRHPTRPLAVPLGNGWARIVPPQSCTTVPPRVLRLPSVAAGLAAEQLAVVTEVNANADARMFAILRRDMAAAIAESERQEFARLLQQTRRITELQPDQPAPMHQPWTPERITWFRTVLGSSATLGEIARMLGVTALSVADRAKRPGFSRSALRAEQQANGNIDPKKLTRLLRNPPPAAAPLVANRARDPYLLLLRACLRMRIPRAILPEVLTGKRALPPSLKVLTPASWSEHGASRLLLEAAQRRHHFADPKAAAAWIAKELAAVLPESAKRKLLLPGWPAERDARLRQLVAAHQPLTRIAAQLGVSPGSVRGRAGRLGLIGLVGVYEALPSWRRK